MGRIRELLALPLIGSEGGRFAKRIFLHFFKLETSTFQPFQVEKMRFPRVPAIFRINTEKYGKLD